MKDFFNGNEYMRMKLTPELLEKGILDVCIIKQPRQIVVSYEYEGQQMEPVAIPVLEFPYPTVDQLDNLVYGSMSLETLTDLKGHVILQYGPNWKQIYNGVDATEKEKEKEKGKEEHKQDRKTAIKIKKYTGNGRLPLHESVIIGLTPKFVTLDKQGQPTFLDKIDFGLETLVPGDSIHTISPLPYIFDSEEQFKQCLELARKESFDTLFSKVELVFKRYVDVEDYYYPILVGDIIWSHFQDKFAYTRYNFFDGDNGSGKNSALLVLKYLGYRVFYINSATAPNYYTQMGSIEEGQCTIAEDEAEDMAYDRDKNKVITTGYASGGSVPKTEMEGGRHQDNWLTYGHKWFAMEELPDEKKMKAILDRSFVFHFIAGEVPYNIKDVVKSAGDPKYQPLYEELMQLRRLLFCYRLLHYNDIILDVELNVRNRSAELTSPLIRLFANSPLALERIIDSLSKFMIERNNSLGCNWPVDCHFFVIVVIIIFILAHTAFDSSDIYAIVILCGILFALYFAISRFAKNEW
jgi:hypothetical protein